MTPSINFILPGFYQAWVGRYQRGLTLMALIPILSPLILPSIALYIYAIFDGYRIAGRMDATS
jgi:hypothetical protein